MTVYAYSRVSTTQQAEEGVSLDKQHRRIDGQALMEGWTIGERFVETGVSGSVPLGERPQGGKLLALLQPGDIVIAAKLDRMFRSALDALTVIKDFQKRGVSLWLLDVGGDVSGNGIAKLLLTVLSAFAEFERDRISERIKDAKRQMRAEGRSQGGKRPFGYQVDADGKLRADPREMPALAAMRELRSAGKSYRAIAQTLAEDGITVDYTTVRNILQRENAFKASIPGNGGQ
jgi:DNA invertase Pin-like site-specific DNA recombinase